MIKMTTPSLKNSIGNGVRFCVLVLVLAPSDLFIFPYFSSSFFLLSIFSVFPFFFFSFLLAFLLCLLHPTQFRCLPHPQLSITLPPPLCPIKKPFKVAGFGNISSARSFLHDILVAAPAAAKEENHAGSRSQSSFATRRILHLGQSGSGMFGFLDAFSHFYKRVCPSVCPSVCCKQGEFLRKGMDFTK